MTNTQRKMSRIESQVRSIVNDIEQGIAITKDDIEGGYYDYDYNEGDILTALDYTKDALETTYLVHKNDLDDFDLDDFYKWDDEYYRLSRSDYNELLKVNPVHMCEGFAVLVAYGGPNIWINTKDQQVEGFWWGDNFTLSYNNDEMGIHDCEIELIGC
jgi:hypothetical protein